MRAVVCLLLLVATARAEEPSPAPELVPVFAPAPVAAPREKPVGWAVLAGMATALVPLAIGGALSTSSDLDTQVAGTYVFMTGLTLAPLAAHAVVGEWGRGALFAGLPATAFAGMTWLLVDRPTVLIEGNKDHTRVAYAILVGFAALSSVGGVVDALLAEERAKSRRERKLTVAPFFGPGQVGLTLGGRM